MKFPETVKGIRPMTDFEKTYQNYNPRQAALDEARALLTAAAKAAMADGTLPEAELPAFKIYTYYATTVIVIVAEFPTASVTVITVVPVPVTPSVVTKPVEFTVALAGTLLTNVKAPTLLVTIN